MNALDIQTGIHFAQVREDYRVEQTVIQTVAQQLDRPVRVLMIGSGGCTALPLIGMDEVESVDVIDANLGQLALLEAKLAAYRHCRPDTLLDLFGYTAMNPDTRENLMRAVLRPRVDPGVRDYLSQHPQIMQLGLDQCGRFEALFAELRSNLGFHDPYDSAHHLWQMAFRRTFDRQHLIDVFGPEAVNYSMRQEFNTHFARVFEHQCASDQFNPYLRSVLEAPQALADAMQPRLAYTQQQVQALKDDEVGQKLRCDHGLFHQFIHHAVSQWDVIHLSNITDWMPFDVAKGVLTDVSARLHPEGAVIGRRLNGDYDLDTTLASVFNADSAVNAGLKRRETAFFYDQVGVGSHSPATLMALGDVVCAS